MRQIASRVTAHDTQITTQHPASPASDALTVHGLEARPRYWGFISYSSLDRVWARWMHHKIETYRVPRPLVGRPGAHGPTPRRLLPLFLDREEMAASADLPGEIQQALRESRYLIVICSPNAAASPWVCKEIDYFQSLGRGDRILCMLVSGQPAEAFPAVLRNAEQEPLAADARQVGDGKAKAFIKIVAGILGMPLDELVRRERRRAAIRRLLYAATALVACLAVTAFWVVAERSAHDRRVVEARRLASESGRAQSDPELSLLLAMAATHVGLAVGDPTPVAVEQSLRDALSRVGGVALRGHEPVSTSQFGASASIARGAIQVGTDGKLVVTGGRDGSVRFWRPGDGRVPWTAVAYGEPVRALKQSPDGKLLLILGENGRVGLVDLTQPTPAITALPSHQGRAVTGAFSSDGRHVASGGIDGRVTLTELRDGRTEGGSSRTMLTHGHVVALCFVANDTLAIANICDRWEKSPTCSSDVQIWKDTQPAFSLPGVDRPIDVRGSEGQPTFAVADLGGVVTIYGSVQLSPASKPWRRIEVETGAEDGDDRSVSIALARDGELLATFGRHSGVRVYDLSTSEARPRTLREPRTQDDFYEVQLTQDGRLLAVGGSEPMLWQVADDSGAGEPIPGLSGAVLALAFSADGAWLAAGGADPAARLWDLRRPLASAANGLRVRGRSMATGAKLSAIGGDTLEIVDRAGLSIIAAVGRENGEPVYDIEASSNGTWVAVRSAAGAIDLYGTSNLSTRHRVMSADADTMAFSPDERWLVIADQQGDLWGWLLSRGTPVKTAVLPAIAAARGSPTANVLRFSQNGDRLALGRRDGVAEVLAVTGEQIGTPLLFQAHAGELTDLAFDTGGTRILTGGTDGKVRLWELESGASAPTLLQEVGGFLGWVHSVALSPDGQWLAAGGGHVQQNGLDTSRTDSRILAWRVNEPGRAPIELVGHTGWIVDLAFFRGSQRLLSNAEDGARLWTLASDNIESPAVFLPGIRGTLAADGASLLALKHHELRIYSLDMRRLLTRAKQSVSRELTEAEIARFFPAGPPPMLSLPAPRPSSQ